ncbi:MAG: alpha/beta hydrolase [Erysipelotrichaceae bacterium]|nr:alpha/beta hydrolase [Erysipelotrichaceae bacterium]
MKIEVKDYTYETIPEYTDKVEGAKEIMMNGDEVSVDYIPDVVYDHKDDNDLHLQILVPKLYNQSKTYPCICYVQGSAWKKQNCYRELVNLGKLAVKGYVIAVVEYRHSEIAHFPAQIIDAKNAIRFMKAHCDDYSINKDDMIIMGNSSGGHVSSIVGMTAKTDKFDEPINDENCYVKGIINQYGAVEVTLEDGFPTTPDHQLPTSPEGMLMGYNIRENKEKAEIANAKTYVNENFDAPILIMHGTKDTLVFCQQSVNLYQALKEAHKDVELYFIRHADHGGPVFFKDEVLDVIDEFIQRCLD